MRSGILNSLFILIFFCGTTHAGSFIMVDVAYQYSAGSYGQETDTIIESTPFTFSLINGAWHAQLSLSYLKVKGDGTIIPGVNGGIVSNIDIIGLSSGDVPVASLPVNTTTETSGNIVSESGAGDTIISLGYTVAQKNPGAMLLSLGSRIKLATADPAKNLGTGENDYTLQVDGYYGHSGFAPFYTVGYIFVGDTEEIAYKNISYASTGFILPVTEIFTTQLVYDYRTPSIDGAESFQQISLAIDWKSSGNWSGNIVMLTGLTDAAPDIGFVMGLRRYY